MRSGLILPPAALGLSVRLSGALRLLNGRRVHFIDAFISVCPTLTDLRIDLGNPEYRAIMRRWIQTTHYL